MIPLPPSACSMQRKKLLRNSHGNPNPALLTEHAIPIFKDCECFP